MENNSLVTFIWVCGGARTQRLHTLCRYLGELREFDEPHELIVVANGLREPEALEVENYLREALVPVSLVRLHREASASTALKSGCREARGSRVVLLPSMPQCDLHDLPQMLEKLNGECDYVSSVRTPRVDSWCARLRSRLYNGLVRWMSGVELHDINSELRVMRRELLERLPTYGDLYLYLPVLAARQGYRVGEAPVRHTATWPGGPGGVFGSCVRRSLDLLALFFLLRFTYRPFRFFGGMGSALMVAGLFLLAVLAVQHVAGLPLTERPLLVLAAMLMVFGVQLFSFGLLGELILFCNRHQLEDYCVERVLTCHRNDAEQDEVYDRAASTQLLSS